MEKLKAWQDIHAQGKQPAAFERWTDKDERKLLEASRVDINVGDTALGRMQKRKMNDFKQAAKMMTQEEWEETVSARESALNFLVDSTVDGE